MRYDKSISWHKTLIGLFKKKKKTEKNSFETHGTLDIKPGITEYVTFAIGKVANITMTPSKTKNI